MNLNTLKAFRQQVYDCMEKRADSLCDSEEHLFRFLKQDLLWLRAYVRTPEQFVRWSWIVALAFTQLCLARPLGLQALLPWEAKGRPVTPRQEPRQ